MSKKFTEEHYQKIVEIQEEIFPNTIISEGMHINDGGFWSVVSEKMPLLSKYVSDNDLHFELAAIANPLTREWAHDKFVEKGKKYYWNSIKTDSSDNHLRLFRHENGVISAYSRFEPANNISEDEQLTESEIREWGFNPDMFDREE